MVWRGYYKLSCKDKLKALAKMIHFIERQHNDLGFKIKIKRSKNEDRIQD